MNKARNPDKHLEEHECWVCRKLIRKYCQHHHVMRKAEDPDLTVPLCRGCHYLVTQIARRKFLSVPQCMEDLITLARFSAGLLDARTTVTYRYTTLGDES